MSALQRLLQREHEWDRSNIEAKLWVFPRCLRYPHGVEISLACSAQQAEIRARGGESKKVVGVFASTVVTMTAGTCASSKLSSSSKLLSSSISAVVTISVHHTKTLTRNEYSALMPNFMFLNFLFPFMNSVFFGN